jgi:HEAT repeat protein
MTQSNSAAIIAQAKKLLAEGKQDEAHDLLLDEGYVLRSEPTIQKAFLKLTPIRPTLQTLLDERYRGLYSVDSKVRFKAIASVNSELCRQTLRNNVFWMRDPRAADPIIKALSDPDAKVAERAWITAAHLVNYFPDQRLLPLALKKLKNPKPNHRAIAIGIISAFRNEELLLHLVDVLDHGEEGDRMAVISQVWGHFLEESRLKALRPYLPVIRWSPSGRTLWKRKFINALSEQNRTIRTQAVHGLRALGESDALPELEAARQREQDADILYRLDEAIKGIKSGETWAGY